jgi:glycosyltransferase involved in cell wall biosynthesis
VITPSLNHGEFIEDTIKSVLAQNYPNIEYIIIDGGSTDDTIEIIEKYRDRVRCISEPDDGQADAINKGFKMSRGEIVAWLNSDDTYCPGAISTAVDYLVRHSDVCMTYGDGYEIDEQGSIIRKLPCPQGFDLQKLIYVFDYILQPTVFMRKEALLKVGFLEKSLNWCMDWDLWIRFGKGHKVAYVPFFFANSRIHTTTKTALGGLERLKEIAYVMRKHGKKRYPLGLFIYGLGTLETDIRRRFPLLHSLVFRYIRPIFKYIVHGVVYRTRSVFKDTWAPK